MKSLEKYNIPSFDCPEDHSRLHKEELAHVSSCYDHSHLSNKFLNLSHQSCKKIFKNYLKNNNVKVDWKKINKCINEVKDITHSLKKKYKRERPKFYLKEIDDHYSNIEDMGSYSFPSGHTTTAHFIAELIGKNFPENADALKDIARLVGQSRIENGVHYPTDVWAGQLLGETFANYFDVEINKKDKEIKKKFNSISRKDERTFCKKLISLSREYYPNMSEKKQIENYCEDMTQFIELSNEIENYDVDKCFKACLNFFLGYPISYCTDDEYITSHLKMLVGSNKTTKEDCIENYCSIHSLIGDKVLESGTPGSIRINAGKSRSGNEYAKPGNIAKYCNSLKDCSNPFAKHILYEWIHPFTDGNGRSGRIILAKDLKYDFAKCVHFCGKNYITRIENFINRFESLENIFS